MIREPFPHLSRPINIGGLKLGNRLTVAPLVHNLASESGEVTGKLLDAYSKRGRGGWALVMVEATHVSREYKQFSHMIGIYDDRLIAGLTALAGAIKKGGSLAGIQIMHPGGLAPLRWNNEQPVAPSRVKMAGVETRALEVSEIEKIIDDFASAALRAKRAGFDLVQFHGAHGFLIHQFLSPLWNKREDEYGEPAAFALEIIRKTRNAVGPDYPLSMRISGEEFMGEGDANLEHMKKLAPLLVDASLDCLDVSAGSSAGSGDWVGQPIYYKRGCIVHLAEAIKKVVDVPVVTAGRINSPELAEKIIARGKADIVSMGRGALADPEFARKAFEGRKDEIRACTACYIGCAGIESSGTSCSVNFELGRSKEEYEIKPARQSKKVMVIGGGVAGMEAARIAALRGHEVGLYEKGKSLGGTVSSMAGSIPKVNTQDLLLGVRWLKKEMKKLNVLVKFNTEVTPELVKEEKPDVVILAAGAKASVPEIKGVENKNVITIDDYLVSKRETGKRVVVIGGQNGAEAALSLARAGKKVSIVEERKSIAFAPYLITRRLVLLRHIREEGIQVLKLTRVKEINENGVVIVDQEGNESKLEADSILLALDRVPEDSLEEELKDIVPEVYKVGDCEKPLHTLHAMHSANKVGRLI